VRRATRGASRSDAPGMESMENFGEFTHQLDRLNDSRRTRSTRMVVALFLVCYMSNIYARSLKHR